MTYRLYAIRDSVANQYLAPMVDQSDATAMRNFAHTILTSGGTITTHPQDYDLYYLGDYDSDTGDLRPLPAILVVRGGDIK